MKYCFNCGNELKDEMKFCPSCGQNLQPNALKDEENDKISKGKEFKCPCCGDNLPSFVTHCPSCGFEIRESKVSSSVQDFVEKLAKIDSRKMPEFKESKSLVKSVLGRDFSNKDEKEEAREKFEYEKEQEKVNLIINYPISNTKEDILEFLILADSNIDIKADIDDDVTQAWISKMDQVYHRAEIAFAETSDFNQIKSIYLKKKKEIKEKKWKNILVGLAVFFGYLILMGLVFNPLLTILIVVILIIICFVAFNYFKNNIKNE